MFWWAWSCRAYDSSLDFPTATERRVYPIVLDRAAWPVRSALRPLLPPSAFQTPAASLPPGNSQLPKTPSGCTSCCLTLLLCFPHSVCSYPLSEQGLSFLSISTLPLKMTRQTCYPVRSIKIWSCSLWLSTPCTMYPVSKTSKRLHCYCVSKQNACPDFDRLFPGLCTTLSSTLGLSWHARNIQSPCQPLVLKDHI